MFTLNDIIRLRILILLVLQSIPVMRHAQALTLLHSQSEYCLIDRLQTVGDVWQQIMAVNRDLSGSAYKKLVFYAIHILFKATIINSECHMHYSLQF